MGDRTFSSDDVIRIYEFFLTQSEQERVDEFFAEEEEEEEPPVFLEDLLGLIGLFRQILTPARLVTNFVLARFFFFTGAVSIIQNALSQAEIIINDLLQRGVIDA